MDKAAYVIAQAVCALAEIEAMKAENKQREIEGNSPAHNYDAFFEVTNKYCIGHNAVIGHLYDR